MNKFDIVMTLILDFSLVSSTYSPFLFFVDKMLKSYLTKRNERLIKKKVERSGQAINKTLKKTMML